MVDTNLVILGGAVLVIQLTLIFFGVRDWLKQPDDMPNKNIWLIMIIVINLIGPVIYFIAAPRSDTYEEETVTQSQGWEDY